MGYARVVSAGVVLCMTATSAWAGPDLFGFSYSDLAFSFDGVSSVQTTARDVSLGTVYRNTTPAGTAVLLPGLWSGAEDFLISMTISDLTTTTANGSGSFVARDTQGDTIAGSLSGTWSKTQIGGAAFIGTMTDVAYTSAVDHNFDGHLGSSVSMAFPPTGPWNGTLVQLTAPGGWFTDPAGLPRGFSVNGGSIDATVQSPIIPVPGTLSLALFGLIGTAGAKRWRKGGVTER